jgi:tetratricopeptide (TPR) repeat protein/O-antigen ligase
VLNTIALAVVYALVLWPALAWGGYRGWSLAVTELLALAGLALWVAGMLRSRRLEWRRTALDVPLGLLLLLPLLQLALGNRPLASWALAPPGDPGAPEPFPASTYLVGTVSPGQTLESFLLFATYAAAYVLVVHLVRTRQDLSRLVRALIVAGGVLAFLGLIDYFGGGGWLLRWRVPVSGHRLTGTFVNANHFGAWLVMLASLGIGYLTARRGRGGEAAPLGSLLRSRAAREAAIRRHLPFLAVGVMSVTVVCTLSRGAVLTLLLTAVAMMALMGRLGRMRWSLALVGSVLAVTLAYGAWIGFGPLLARIQQADYSFRWTQWIASAPMLGDFPLLGVGLGGYRDLYYRYQPPSLDPAAGYYPYAHNDWLQAAVELGLAGLVLIALGAWRAVRDLVGAHLLGRGACPVGGGVGQAARRHDAYNIGIALGGIGAALSLAIHSVVDFGARIPANGVLAAACLGIATVALHTRFRSAGGGHIARTRAIALDGKPRLALAAALAVLLAGAAVPLVLRPVQAEAEVAALAVLPAEPPASPEELAADRRAVRAVRARAQAHLEQALRLLDGGPLTEERRAATLERLASARRDLERALAMTPTDPYLHETLGQTHAAAAAADPALARDGSRAALSHLARAVAAAPAYATFHRSAALVAAGLPEPALEIALAAGREAVIRNPDLLGPLVERLAPLRPTTAQWVSLVPPSALDRVQLADALESRGLGAEAEEAYRRALELATRQEQPLVRWALGLLLLARGDHQAATSEVIQALSLDAENPELHLALGRTRAAAGDPSAADAYRAALASAEGLARKRGRESSVFRLDEPRARLLLARRLADHGQPRPARYRRALAEHLSDRQMWSEAAQVWEDLTEENPQDAGAYFGRAVALDELGAKTQAFGAFRRAVALDGNSRYRLRFAESLWEGDQYYQAISEWRAVVEQDPAHVDARLALTRAYLHVGDRLQAYRQYQELQQRVPNHPALRKGLAGLAGQPGN